MIVITYQRKVMLIIQVLVTILLHVLGNVMQIGIEIMRRIYVILVLYDCDIIVMHDLIRKMIVLLHVLEVLM